MSNVSKEIIAEVQPIIDYLERQPRQQMLRSALISYFKPRGFKNARVTIALMVYHDMLIATHQGNPNDRMISLPK